MEDFFTGRGESPFALDPDEMVAEIRLPLSEKGLESSFQKLAYRSALDFALVASAVRIEVKDGEIADARIVIGCGVPER